MTPTTVPSRNHELPAQPFHRRHAVAGIKPHHAFQQRDNQKNTGQHLRFISDIQRKRKAIDRERLDADMGDQDGQKDRGNIDEELEERRLQRTKLPRVL